MIVTQWLDYICEVGETWFLIPMPFRISLFLSNEYSILNILKLGPLFSGIVLSLK